jgi:23S rRNA (adenine2503-C2)-methyltransferase
VSLPAPDMTATPASGRINILGLSRAALEAEVTALGLPKFRARQLWRWVWRHGLTSFDEMSDLGKPVRDQFAGLFTADRPVVSRRLQSGN